MPGTVRMSRRVSFSSGHRFWDDSLSETENRSLFGKTASRFNHGHNYVLEVSVDGTVDKQTGMIVNIKRIDDALKVSVTRRMDGKSINDEVEGYDKTAPCLENLMRSIAGWLGDPGGMPSEATLQTLRLEETPTFYGELDLHARYQAMKLTRVYEFAASHRLHSPLMTDQENLDLFGKCNNLAGHGHNYILEVTVTGEPDPRTGMIVDLDEMDRRVDELVIDKYDHRNLNVDIPEFQGKIPTSEVVIQEIFNSLDNRLPARLVRVRLQETARNVFEVSAE